MGSTIYDQTLRHPVFIGLDVKETIRKMGDLEEEVIASGNTTTKEYVELHHCIVDMFMAFAIQIRAAKDREKAFMQQIQQKEIELINTKTCLEREKLSREAESSSLKDQRRDWKREHETLRGKYERLKRQNSILESQFDESIRSIQAAEAKWRSQTDRSKADCEKLRRKLKQYEAHKRSIAIQTETSDVEITVPSLRARSGSHNKIIQIMKEVSPGSYTNDCDSLDISGNSTSVQHELDTNSDRFIGTSKSTDTIDAPWKADDTWRQVLAQIKVTKIQGVDDVEERIVMEELNNLRSEIDGDHSPPGEAWKYVMSCGVLATIIAIKQRVVQVRLKGGRMASTSTYYGLAKNRTGSARRDLIEPSGAVKSAFGPLRGLTQIQATNQENGVPSIMRAKSFRPKSFINNSNNNSNNNNSTAGNGTDSKVRLRRFTYDNKKHQAIKNSLFMSTSPR